MPPYTMSSILTFNDNTPKTDQNYFMWWPQGKMSAFILSLNIQCHYTLFRLIECFVGKFRHVPGVRRIIDILFDSPLTATAATTHNPNTAYSIFYFR